MRHDLSTKTTRWTLIAQICSSSYSHRENAHMEYRITPGRLDIGKFSLYYERIGAGPPIVFLHGLGGNHLSCWQQVPYLMRSFQCITLDQRGFGLSPDPHA